MQSRVERDPALFWSTVRPECNYDSLATGVISFIRFHERVWSTHSKASSYWRNLPIHQLTRSDGYVLKEDERTDLPHQSSWLLCELPHHVLTIQNDNVEESLNFTIDKALSAYPLTRPCADQQMTKIDLSCLTGFFSRALY